MIDYIVIWAEVDWNICRGCDPCQARMACNTRAILKYDPDDLAFIELSRCRGCGKCLQACDYTAIRIHRSNKNSEGRS